jgi:hypothetical protein
MWLNSLGFCGILPNFPFLQPPLCVVRGSLDPARTGALWEGCLPGAGRRCPRAENVGVRCRWRSASGKSSQATTRAAKQPGIDRVVGCSKVASRVGTAGSEISPARCFVGQAGEPRNRRAASMRVSAADPIAALIIPDDLQIVSVTRVATALDCTEQSCRRKAFPLRCTCCETWAEVGRGLRRHFTRLSTSTSCPWTRLSEPHARQICR